MNNEKLDALNSEIFCCQYGKVCPTLGCKEHSLNGNRSAIYIHPSPGYFGKEYDPERDILFIAQNPGKPTASVYDIQQYQKDLTADRRMLYYGDVLKSYYMTQNIVLSLNIDWNRMAWTNVVKCPTLDNHPIGMKEFHLCSPYLKRQLAVINPSLIVSMGQWSATMLTNSNFSYGVSAQLNRCVITMPHYSHSNIADWIGELVRYVAKAKQIKSAKLGW